MKRIIAREGNRVTYEYPSRVTKDPETGMVDAEYDGGTRVVHVVSAEPITPGTTNAEHTQRVAETAARLATMTAEASAQKRQDEDAVTIARLRRQLAEAAEQLAAQERISAGLAEEVERLRESAPPSPLVLGAAVPVIDSAEKWWDLYGTEPPPWFLGALERQSSEPPVFSMPLVPIDPEAEKLVDGLVREAMAGVPVKSVDLRDGRIDSAAEFDDGGFYRGTQRVVGGVVSGPDGCFAVDVDPPLEVTEGEPVAGASGLTVAVDPEADTQRIPRVKSEPPPPLVTGED